MRKLITLIVLLSTTSIYSQTALEGVWKNLEGETLIMGWKTFERTSPTLTVTGTWDFVDDSYKLNITRSTGEQYELHYYISGSTMAITKPFTPVEKSWIFIKQSN